jgi:hypothetical protein
MRGVLRKVCDGGVPTPTIDFSLGGPALLPIVLPGLTLYGLLRGAPRAEAGDHRAAGAPEDEHVGVRAVEAIAGWEARHQEGLYLLYQAFERDGPRHTPYGFLDEGCLLC